MKICLRLSFYSTIDYFATLAHWSYPFDVVGNLKARGVSFQSLNETIGTTTANGELIFYLFASIAQFERTQAGFMAAKKRGVLSFIIEPNYVLVYHNSVNSLQ
uniref:Resolvase/invertase-type recombinase catalytic domain-containing protein n=1 Tax=OCS116 cluster bacterium TaxID=2030921 RepID=A0A2A4Z6F5_9PROT